MCLCACVWRIFTALHCCRHSVANHIFIEPAGKIFAICKAHSCLELFVAVFLYYVFFSLIVSLSNIQSVSSWVRCLLFLVVVAGVVCFFIFAACLSHESKIPIVCAFVRSFRCVFLFLQWHSKDVIDQTAYHIDDWILWSTY